MHPFDNSKTRPAKEEIILFKEDVIFL